MVSSSVLKEIDSEARALKRGKPFNGVLLKTER